MEKLKNKVLDIMQYMLLKTIVLGAATLIIIGFLIGLVRTFFSDWGSPRGAEVIPLNRKKKGSK